MEWIDATLPMRLDLVHWPGHPRYTIDVMMSMDDESEVMNVTAVSFCSHFGTHVDAPSHYVKDGTTVDRIPLDVLVGPCRVVHYTGSEHIPETYIRSLDLGETSRLLIRTSNSDFLNGPDFREDYIALSVAAAGALGELGVKLVGVDGYSIGPFDPEMGIPAHQAFLGASPHQVAVEEVNLSGITEGEYDLIALPSRFEGLEAAPTRVLLRPREK